MELRTASPSVIRTRAVAAFVASVLCTVASAQIRSVSLATGDVDRDGFEDVVVGDSYLERDGSCGEVHVVCGRTGRELWRTVGVASERRVGMGVAVLVEGVSEPLVLVAAADLTTNELMLDVYRGTQGSLLCSHRLLASKDEHPHCSIAVLDDIDGDGVADIAVGRRSFGAAEAADQVGRLSVISLRDGCELAAIEGNRVGGLLASGYFDAAAGKDIVTVDQWRGAERVLWLSGPSLEVITQVTSDPLGTWIGQSLATIGDWNHDGLDEVVVGAMGEPCAEPDVWDLCRGELRVYSPDSVVPLLTLCVDGVEANKGPFFTSLSGLGPRRLIAMGTPWENWSAGVVRILDHTGTVLSSFHKDAFADRREFDPTNPRVPRDRPGRYDNYYAIALAQSRAVGSPKPRLIAVAEPDDQVSATRPPMAVECRGGEDWRQLLWRYELEGKVGR